MLPINGFFGVFRFLSNFYESEVTVYGKTWPTAEHAYQAQKCLKEADQETIRLAKTPGMAKKLGKLAEQRPDWMKIRLAVMETVVRAKFENRQLQMLLFVTSPAELIEMNSWGDTFWGTDQQGNGTNHLGRILMAIRNEITE